MYKPCIGLEVHVELKTNSKFFSFSKNSSIELPNHNVNYIDLAYPGTLPRLNREVIEIGVKAATLLNCEISKDMFFDRKNYFYADIPKNYQITQNATPIGKGGYIEIELSDGSKKQIRLHDIHLEEDTAKSVYKNGKTYLDYNRAGVPLLEIVSEPDIKSSEEAILYLEKLRELLLYADISDCKIENGSMRCDVNVSISTTDELGTKIEIKNIGSISNVGIAIEKEIERQQLLLNDGEVLVEETRRFDETDKKTILMRVKETGNDYRYFRDADLPTIHLDDEYILKIQNSMPRSASELRTIFIEKNILEININKLINNKDYGLFMSKFINSDVDLVKLSNLLLGPIAECLNSLNKTTSDTTMTYENIIMLMDLMDKGIIDFKKFKNICNDLIFSNDWKSIIDKELMSQLSDEDIVKLINEIMEENPGKSDKVVMGQVMKRSGGKASPQRVIQLIADRFKGE